MTDPRQTVEDSNLYADAQKIFSNTSYMEQQRDQYHTVTAALPLAQGVSVLFATPVLVVVLLLLYALDVPYWQYICAVPAFAILVLFEKKIKEPTIGRWVRQYIRYRFRNTTLLQSERIKSPRLMTTTAACLCTLASIVASCAGVYIFTQQTADKSEEITAHYSAEEQAIRNRAVASIAEVEAKEKAYKEEVRYRGRINIHNPATKKRIAEYTQQMADIRAQRDAELAALPAQLDNDLTNNTDHTTRSVIIMLVVSLLVELSIIYCLYNKYDYLALSYIEGNLSRPESVSTPAPILSPLSADSRKRLTDNALTQNLTVSDSPIVVTVPVPTDRTISEIEDTEVSEVIVPEIVMDKIGTYINTTKKLLKRAHFPEAAPATRKRRLAKFNARCAKLREAGYTVEIDGDKVNIKR